jgi:hypothetical protein
MQTSPLLIAFRLKISPNEPAMTSGIPAALRAVAACSRDEPVPKLYPETRMTPSFVSASDDDDDVLWLGANGGDEGGKGRVVVLHHDFCLLLESDVVLVGVFPWVDPVRVQVILRSEQQRSSERGWESW